MIEDKDVNIQVYSCGEGHTIQVLKAEGDQILFIKHWQPREDYLDFGEGNFVKLLEFLGYRVYHEEME